MQLTITNAGRTAIIDAQNSGFNKVKITAVGFGSAAYTPNASATALVSETKRIAGVSGGVIGSDIIHLTAVDNSTDTYTVREVGFFTDTGVLLGLYSAPSAIIIEKAAVSSLFIAFDLTLQPDDAAVIEFGDTDFLLPPATQQTDGVMSSADKTKLDSIAAGANAYEHPSTHPASIITEETNKRFMTDAERSKLSGIAAGATANATDAALRARSSHTGTQAISTVDGLQTALDAKLASNHASVTNAREWIASEVSKAEAEAGTASTARKWTAARIAEAIAALAHASAFKAGTTMLFVQAAAPVGWTKSTTHDNKALRIVSGVGGGTGGSLAFSEAFSAIKVVSVSVNGTSLTSSQGPSITGSFDIGSRYSGSVSNVIGNSSGAFSAGAASTGGNLNRIDNDFASVASQRVSFSAGSSQSHNHAASGATNLNVAYVDAIICVKN